MNTKSNKSNASAPAGSAPSPPSRPPSLASPPPHALGPRPRAPRARRAFGKPCVGLHQDDPPTPAASAARSRAAALAETRSHPA
eukprot:6212740-Pleurochrysis_carterae.AAC.1